MPGDQEDGAPVLSPHREDRMKIGMIVLAGGVGKRIGRPFPKQFLLLGGKPLIVHVLEKARVIPDIDRVIITCPDNHLEETRELIARHGFDEARFTCIVGGTSRQESVYLGLGELADVDSVIIHEAVRPLVTVAEFRELIAAPDLNAMFGTRSHSPCSRATTTSRTCWSATS